MTPVQSMKTMRDFESDVRALGDWEMRKIKLPWHTLVQI